MSKKAHNRPSNLPDFLNPPLSEAVLGVQFTPPNGYQQILAGEVWNLYRDDYPKVEEKAPLEPAFEVFGLPSFSPQGQVKFLTGANHDRFWFIGNGGAELIQFQNDKFLHNWRDGIDLSSKYPRFEIMLSKFNSEIHKLQSYMHSLSGQELSINQCEISYINSILTPEPEDNLPHKWLTFFDPKSSEPDDFNFTFREVIYGADSAPQGRITIEASTAINQKNQRLIRLTLTVRGAPKNNTIESALEFMQVGRNIIVTKFAELTTSYAHERWGRVK